MCQWQQKRKQIGYGGAAFIDVISPCVAFNNHAGSTKSYDYVREHNEAVSRIDFITPRSEITTDYAPGEVVEALQHDGLVLCLRKLHEGYDPTDRLAAMNLVQMHQAPNTSAKPLNALVCEEPCPGTQALIALNAALR